MSVTQIRIDEVKQVLSMPSRPFRIDEIAELIGRHESTVDRVIKHSKEVKRMIKSNRAHYRDLEAEKAVSVLRGDKRIRDITSLGVELGFSYTKTQRLVTEHLAVAIQLFKNKKGD